MVYEDKAWGHQYTGACVMSAQMDFTYQSPSAQANNVSEMLFLLRRYAAQMRTVTLAKVISCTNTGGLVVAGTVNIQLLLNQLDSAGNEEPLPVIYNVPYIRAQGGVNAFIMDPAENDIGLVCFGDRDLSAIIASKGAAAPGSNRRFSLSDALYIGGLLNAVPTQYVQFNNNGINVVTPNALQITTGSGGSQAQLTMNASGIDMTFDGNGIQVNSSGIVFTGPVTGNSTATFSGEGTFNGGHTVSAHDHKFVAQAGSANLVTQPPTG
jgi:hypothetical protein